MLHILSICVVSVLDFGNSNKHVALLVIGGFFVDGVGFICCGLFVSTNPVTAHLRASRWSLLPLPQLAESTCSRIPSGPAQRFLPEGWLS